MDYEYSQHLRALIKLTLESAGIRCRTALVWNEDEPQIDIFCRQWQFTPGQDLIKGLGKIPVCFRVEPGRSKP